MTDNLLTLNCLVDGLPTSRAFSIKISFADTVGDLKKLIKLEQTPAFDDITVDQLNLWCVSIPDDDDEDEIPIVLDNVNNKDKKKLRATRGLLEVFPDKPPKNTIHVIVQRPPQVHAPAPSRSLTPLSGNQSDQPRPPSPANIRAELDEITVEFFNPASQYITFLNEFVQGFHDLPVTEGNISGLPCVGKR
ncbi:hypothetical protein BGW39_003817, partial [Mortierella sp. 14UC]